MDRSYRAWYVLVALVALVPAGARMLLWHRARPEAVNPAMAQAGEVLFKHDWQEHNALSPDGDGIGPVFNATSCVACHNQGGPGGGGGLEHNVTTFTVRASESSAAREGVIHAFAVGAFQETLKAIDARLPPVARPTLEQLVVVARDRSGHCLAPSFPRGIHISQRNTPALFGDKLIDEIPERVIVAGEKSQRLKWGMAPADGEEVPVGRAPRLASGRVGRFGWKGQTASLADFVQAACANELGLSNPGHEQPRPLGKPEYQVTGLDLTAEQCNQLTSFVASLPQPTERAPESPGLREDAVVGKKLFHSVGCAECHTPNLGSVEGIYSDLLLHRMGQDLVGGGSYGEPPLPLPDGKPGEGPSPSEWRTPPLWGVADSAPYLHDGRAATLEDAIRLHGGQGQRAASKFQQLASEDQARLIGFLKTLRIP